MAEVRTQFEGSLWWVQASGSGRTWATAATPASGLVGFCTDMSFTSGQTITTVSDRGIPHHHKVTEKARIEPTFSLMWTGQHAVPTATGGGASVPMFHLELKSLEPENAGSGRYYQFHGCALQSFDFKEAKDGNTVTMKCAALAMNGVTASGYLS
jgi:hypothetical protein